jgi:hypothetical protein
MRRRQLSEPHALQHGETGNNMIQMKPRCVVQAS